MNIHLEMAPPAVSEIVTDTIFAISDFVPGDMPLTWIPDFGDHFIPVSFYIVRNGGEALVIDTGIAVNRGKLIAQARAILAGCHENALIMTRREPDSIINLPAMVNELGLAKIYCGGPISPLTFFDRVDSLSIQSMVNSVANTGITWLAPGEAIKVGRLSVKVLSTPLAVLPKSHLFEENSRTLFGSDSWGFAGQGQNLRLETIRGDDERLATNRIVRYLRRKFIWLCSADISLVERSLEDLRDNFRVRRICSGYGGAIEGEELCTTIFDRTLAAVRELSAEPFVDKVDEFLTAYEGSMTKSHRR